MGLSSTSPVIALFLSFSLRELRQHPWRNAAAVVSVMLGVALAFSVHLINASALDEFGQALRAVGGQPDLELRARDGSSSGLDEAWLGRMAQHPDVEWASPVLEFGSYALTQDDAASQRVALRVLGVDALSVVAVASDLLPLPDALQDRLAVFAPDSGFLNASARQR
ncbi:MAG: ABC transporter permease, partial [Rhodoferax sp.]